MKYSYAIGAALAGQAVAFPANMPASLISEADPEALKEMAKRQVLGVNIKFDPNAQYVSTHGPHEFQPPSATDIRGPCPGLNAMANHNYIPRNGVASIEQYIQGTYQAFGMSVDLSGFLAIYGAIFDGDLGGWSIGGPTSQSLLAPLAPIVGTPKGLSGSHNKYEGDASPTRPDLYMYGNDYTLILDQFKELYGYQSSETEETSNFELGILTAHRAARFNQSQTENPYFFNNFFSGLLVQPAAYTFIYRFMANKSQEYPEGRLSQNVLKSFFSIEGDKPEDFKWIPGNERIPENWYKRAVGDEYSIPFFLLDVLAAAQEHPQFLDVGGNTGAPNTFTGLDIANITGGVYNIGRFVQDPQMLFCFVYQTIQQQSPDLLFGLQHTLADASPLMERLSSFLDTFGCPQLDKVLNDQYERNVYKYPGLTKLNADGTYRK